LVDRLAFGPAYGYRETPFAGRPWVVTEPDGKVVNPDTLLKRWKALAKAAGVKVIPLHSGRHS
jgi:hypothetical protein